MTRKRRYIHPDEPMTRGAWLILIVLALELIGFLYVSGALRPLSTL